MRAPALCAMGHCSGPINLRPRRNEEEIAAGGWARVRDFSPRLVNRLARIYTVRVLGEFEGAGFVFFWLGLVKRFDRYLSVLDDFE